MCNKCDKCYKMYKVQNLFGLSLSFESQMPEDVVDQMNNILVQ